MRFSTPTLALVCLAALAAPASSETPVFTAAWEGVWEFDYIERECATGTVTAEYQGVEYLCAGGRPSITTGPFEYECEGEITDTDLHVVCTGSAEAIPGCTANYVYVLDATRTGTTITGLETWEVGFVGACGGMEGICYDESYSGRKIDDDPDCSVTPTEPMSWTKIKSEFR